jgi:hypothetical protein
LLTTLCHGIDIKAKHAGDHRVTSTPEAERLQTGIQSTLLSIEQAQEEDNGYARFMNDRTSKLFIE